ncbi:MAG TPA: hypothetical protein VFU22_18990, partial [Roseiflexaceae bacterium]|nr:hypothetical protein [Roseiflexaceae bacterium]
TTWLVRVDNETGAKAYRQYISDAKKIAQQAPELLEDVRSGDKSITDTKRELKEREREQVREHDHALVASTLLVILKSV